MPVLSCPLIVNREPYNCYIISRFEIGIAQPSHAILLDVFDEWYLKNTYLKESFTRSSTVIYSTN